MIIVRNWFCFLLELKLLTIRNISYDFKIERWWRELHQRMEKFFKFPLNQLKDHGHYDPQDENHR